ncbi:DNA-directed RNA polymerase, mitochondrial [Marchantia polymorpha subsp. ruderalis]|uniref:DNA-directed RNA polymerase n=2 Tax=Marchantia polymorpha TaxID=3197 RepID=A0AAF6AWI3_MARPO|nr:hypothetical protein MARPO_0007s0198 [Marchantia polymorpha]BBN04117.1 hypothetical protein Mp_3g02090 [Marchantia polymorpha subsp. ruderalis]|eukprot:PTQ47804.1 hypothetical protein MARPO_0007s0198 [Marchantia polymorpha]
MWRIAVRQLTRNQQQRIGAGLQDSAAAWKLWCCRPTSTSAAAAEPAAELSNAELSDVGWEFQSHRLASSAVSSFGSAPSPILPRCSINSLEASVSTLDTALHSAVHLPLLANQIWWMQWLSDSSPDVLDQSASGPRTVGQFVPPKPRLGLKNFASAAALEHEQDDDDEQEQPKEQIPKAGSVSIKSKKVKERYSKLHERQMDVESKAWEAAAAEYRELMLEMCKKNLAPNLPFVQSLVLGWFEPLKNAIEAEQKAVENLEFREHRAGYGPFLCQLPADMLAVITMHKIMGMLMSDLSNGGCVKVVSAAAQIGEAVEQEVGIHKLMRKSAKKKKGKIDPKKVVDPKEQAAASADVKLKDQVKKLLKQQKLRVASSLVRHANGDEPWGSEIRVKVGCRLIEIMIEVALLQPPASQTEEDIGELRPAFKHSMKTFPGQSAARKFGVIECDPLVAQELDKSVRHMVMPYMPMLVRPRKWTGYGNGGYLILPATVMRIHGAKQQREAIQKATRTSMHNVFHALNTLGSVRWKINTRVLDVIEEIWKDGGRLAQMVDADNVSVPSRPCTEDEAEIRGWRREAGKAKRINCERHSLRCDTELKLTVARKLRDEEAFYYPHNLDFRGRAYPLHPHLNHLGSDMCRGVLEFAEGHPLGTTGLRWLKIHLANVFAGGVDKLSFDGRVAFAEEKMDEVFDSAERPLEGRRWWLEAEDPFQCLATCMALRDALSSGDVENYVCNLPVHQDGSCNGLQHYAALGRDQVGAEAVNLIAGDAPADVYSGIASRVRAVIEKDAADDPRVNPNVDKAKLLLGQIDRKLVKQTVMTSVYGVTFIGARNQILSRLKERGLPDESAMYRASCYAAKVTIDALGQMFKEARCIMSWLGECAKIIAMEGEPVRWTTPFGLPVVQPYRKPGRKMVKTSLQVLALREDGNQPVAVARQRSAFPPNFVHSLDGSHMMMTAIACKRAGLNFAGVHDSFWTHAGTVDKMNILLRKKFVQLYSQPILENLLNDFKQQFPHLEFPQVPGRGDLDLNEVLKAPYFFN